MKRESSLALRDHSRETKGASKVKKRKTAFILPLEKKTENIPFHNIEEQQSKYRFVHSFKEQVSSKLSEKLKTIGKCIEKNLNKKQMETYSKLCREIEKQFSIRAALDDNECEGNSVKIKQLKGYLSRILQKEEDLIKQWTSILFQSPHSTNNNSGVFTNDLIARQMSPKHSFNIFALLQKKQMEYEQHLKSLEDTLSKKDQVIKALFEKMEKIAGQQQKPSTFRKCMDKITEKIEYQGSKHSLLREVEEKLKCQFIQTDNLTQENVILKDENSNLCRQMNVVEEERERLEKKYRDLNEEFEELVGQKLELQILNTKKQKQSSRLTSFYSNLLSKSKQKLEEVVREELNLMKTKYEYEKNCIMQEMSMCWSVLRGQVQNLIQMIEVTNEGEMEKLSEKCFNLERKYRNVEIQCQRLRNNQEEKVQMMWQIEGKKKQRIKIQGKIFYHSILPTKAKLSFYRYNIYEQEVLSENAKWKNTQTQTQKTIKSLTFQALQNILVESIKKDMKSQVSQTHISEVKEFGNQTESLDMIVMETQTSPQIFHLCTAVIQQNFQFIQQKQKVTNFSNIKVCEVTYVCRKQFQEKGNQTESVDPLRFPIQEDPEEQTFLQMQISQQEHGGEQNEGQIIRMLQQAEDLLEVPQIEVLKFEIESYKEEIEGMRVRINQLEKEKEQQNVFNFRL